MTNAVLFVSNDEIRGFEIKDHAGYADYGQDIVCAAISALSQTAVMGLQEVVGIECRVEIQDAYLACRLSQNASAEIWQQSQVILQTLAKGLKAIAAEYPDYLSVREVQSL